MVSDHDCHHRLGHRDETGQQARIVSTFGSNRGGLGLARHGGLFKWQAARRLDGGTKDDWKARRDATEHAAVSIGVGRDSRMSGSRMLGIRHEVVVVFAAAHRNATESDAVFDAKNGWQAEECFRQIGFDLIEYGLAQTGGNM